MSNCNAKIIRGQRLRGNVERASGTEKAGNIWAPAETRSFCRNQWRQPSSSFSAGGVSAPGMAPRITGAEVLSKAEQGQNAPSVLSNNVLPNCSS